MYILKTFICNDQNNEIYPQVIHMGSNYGWDAEDSLTKITSNKPLHFIPNLKSFHLDPTTKITDIISQSYIYTCGLLVSEALSNALKNYLLQPHSIYPSEVIHDESVFKYYWIHITEEIETYIDFRGSEFSIQKECLDNSLSIRISNEEELRAICKDLVHSMGGDIIARKIEFMPNIPSYDLFFLQLTSRFIFISDRLRNCLLKERFTGFEILPATTVFSFK